MSTVILAHFRVGIDPMDAYVRWLNDAEVTRYLECRFRQWWTEGQAREYVAEQNSKPWVEFRRICLEDGTCIGTIKVEAEPNHVSLLRFFLTHSTSRLREGGIFIATLRSSETVF